MHGLSPFLLRFFDQLRKVLLVFAGERAVGHFQQCGNGLLRRASKKCFYHVVQGAGAYLACVIGRQVNILQSHLFMAQISFIFQQPSMPRTAE